MGGIYFPYANMIVLVACLVAIALVYWLIYRTNVGRGMRAMAEDRAVASALGMRTKALFPFAFALATGLAGVTGALVTPSCRLRRMSVTQRSPIRSLPSFWAVWEASPAPPSPLSSSA
ncbi:hypothetical protein HED49_22075 [Ochrobactrum daejeonense]|nr:hypothetical protein [Brucella daejeonensis]